MTVRLIFSILTNAGQESEELGDDVVARLNPQSNEIENLEVLFFSSRLLRRELFELPVTDCSVSVCGQAGERLDLTGAGILRRLSKQTNEDNALF
jgi:hypothetical protein